MKQHTGKNLSLKARIFLFFFGIVFLMTGTYIFTAGRFITRSTREQLDTDYNDILMETCDTVESALWTLTLTSQQLLENDRIRENLSAYLEESDPYRRQNCYRELTQVVSELTMSNSDIALLYFLQVDTGEILYSNLPADKRLRTLPILYHSGEFTFWGPCRSQSNFIGNPVLVMNRTDCLESGEKIILSVESGYYSLDGPLQSAQRKSAYLAFFNEKDSLIYHTLPAEYNAAELIQDLFSGDNREFHFFSRQTQQGWSVSILIPSSVYDKDFRLALRDFILSTVSVAVLVGIFALYFWKSVYRPLQLFDRQLETLVSEKATVERLHSSIPEYEYLLDRIEGLQGQIREMLEQAVRQEQRNAKMQTEKLRAQINPHFLMNTLNTVHWLALMKQQPEIDRIAQSLSHLLSYNLDKESIYTNLKNELSALREYMTLQQVRYTFHFSVLAPEDPAGLNYPCPKFILQPLAENALMHAYRENMEITVKINVDDEWIFLSVRDTGLGMNSQALAKLRGKLCSDFSSGEEKGIGLLYVVRSLDGFYHGDYKLCAESEEGRGTEIRMQFPKLRGSGYHAEGSGH